VVLAESARGVHRYGVDAPRLGESPVVGIDDEPPRRLALRVAMEVTELGAPEVVSLAVLVAEPDDLVRMAKVVGRELDRNHEVDRLPVHLAQVEQMAHRHALDEYFGRVPLERD